LQDGIRLFNDGRYFECHEVLEAEWTSARGPRRLFLQALIHVAVALYHHGRENHVGAIRQMRKALRKLAPCLPIYEGVDTARLEHDATKVLRQIEDGETEIGYPRIHQVMRH
jgi:uncharacterized protein